MPPPDALILRTSSRYSSAAAFNLLLLSGIALSPIGIRRHLGLESRAVLSASFRHFPLLPDSYRCP